MKKTKYLLLILAILVWACDKTVEPEGEILPSIDTTVTSIAIDKSNTKWIATVDGLYRSVEEGYLKQDISVTGKISSLYYEETADLLWIGTEIALLKATITADNLLDADIDSENLSNPNVLTMHVDQDGKRWFGTLDGLSLNYGDSWKKENFRVNTSGDLFPMGIENSAINSIASIDGDYFFATSGVKLYRAFGYDSSVDAFSGATQWSFPYNGQNLSDTMFVVFIDDEGKKWMGGKYGIQVHTGSDPKNPDSFTYYGDEFPDYYVLAIAQATDGNIWVGTRKGLAVFDGSAWETISQGLPDLYITAIAFDEDGSAWIGTKQGLVNIE